MSKLLDFLAGVEVLEQVDSPYNGHLTVVRDFAWGTHIKGGGLTQSGGVAKTVWRASLKEVKKQKKDVNSCLILGLGGGSIAELVNYHWANTKIVGVDIDEVIVSLGKKYMKLGKLNIDIHIEDVEKFLKKNKKSKYDLICVDMYQGDTVPEKFTTEEFIKDVKSILSDNGIVVFNRLYYGEKRKLADEFRRKLENIFNKVEIVFPEANIMYICK